MHEGGAGVTGERFTGGFETGLCLRAGLAARAAPSEKGRRAFPPSASSSPGWQLPSPVPVQGQEEAAGEACVLPELCGDNARPVGVYRCEKPSRFAQQATGAVSRQGWRCRCRPRSQSSAGLCTDRPARLKDSDRILALRGFPASAQFRGTLSFLLLFTPCKEFSINKRNRFIVKRSSAPVPGWGGDFGGPGESVRAQSEACE